MKKYIKTLRSELFKVCFNVGFIDKDGYSDFNELTFDQIKWMDLDGYSHGWFADPFILEVRDKKIFVLVEEYEYNKKKGRLCIITVSKDNYKLLNVKSILELDTHLSYPSVYKIENKIYICPENNEGGSVKAYELVDKKLINPTVLIDEPLVDTQFVEVNGSYYAFGVKNIKGLMSETKELRVFKSDKFLGSYSYLYSIKNDLCEERGAGNIFKVGNTIYRPAQCCEGGYGKAIIIYEMLFDNGKIEEREVFRFSGKVCKKWGVGMHQFHTDEGMTVVDGQEFFHFIARIPKRVQMFIQNF